MIFFFWILSPGTTQKYAVATKSKARTVFDHTNTGIVGSNPIKGRDYVHVFLCVYVVFCRNRLRDGPIPSRPGSPTKHLKDA
jgi:hypothetical protein